LILIGVNFVPKEDQVMRCHCCQSTNLSVFPAEINIHFPGFEHLTRPTVLAFPILLVCLDCGVTQFTLSRDQVRALSEPESSRSDAAAA
jgi:hypothetical protein